ncbi:MAG: LON peptidase substrate-binding domain-containing protein [Devosiaceae bacterium]|nr:LON peptidase substrate-binding domain-containing protein [Devosiaceae bacterium MH13]
MQGKSSGRSEAEAGAEPTPRSGGGREQRSGGIPSIIPVFPLSSALLLPRGQMPLNIFEPRYLAMIDYALGHDRIIGMVQPKFERDGSPVMGLDPDTPPLCAVGCAGRISAFQETDDGRFLITLTGVCRFEVLEEETAITPFRLCRVATERFDRDFRQGEGEKLVDRDTLLLTFKAYLEANDLEADWSGVEKASNEALVNALCMMSPYGPPEKQALLEAEDLKARAETLIAITELSLAREGPEDRATLQ